MPKKPILLINAQECPAGKEKEYNEWYNNHVSELFKFKGMKKAIRYKKVGGDENVPPYIALYYFDSLADYERYMASPEFETGTNLSGRPNGVKRKFRGQFELIKSWER